MLLSHILQCKEQLINQFSTKVPLLYPLKTSENREFSDDVYRGYRSGTLVENELNNIHLAASTKNSMEPSLKRIIKSFKWIKKSFPLNPNNPYFPSDFPP